MQQKHKQHTDTEKQTGQNATKQEQKTYTDIKTKTE